MEAGELGFERFRRDPVRLASAKAPNTISARAPAWPATLDEATPAQLAWELAADAGPLNPSANTSVASAAGFRMVNPFVGGPTADAKRGCSRWKSGRPQSWLRGSTGLPAWSARGRARCSPAASLRDPAPGRVRSMSASAGIDVGGPSSSRASISTSRSRVRASSSSRSGDGRLAWEPSRQLPQMHHSLILWKHRFPKLNEHRPRRPPGVLQESNRRAAADRSLRRAYPGPFRLTPTSPVRAEASRISTRYLDGAACVRNGDRSFSGEGDPDGWTVKRRPLDRVPTATTETPSANDRHGKGSR